MERFSSTIRMLAISSHPGQFDGELRPVIFLRYHCDAPAVRVHDLINDRQSQTRSADKAGLQRLEYFHALSGIDSHSSIAKANAHPKRRCLQLHRQGAAGRHGAERVVAKIPEHLLDLVRIRANPHGPSRKDALNAALALPLRMPLEQSQGLIEQFRKIGFGEFVALFAGVVEEISDDAIEA